jgi:hypothetical protein
MSFAIVITVDLARSEFRPMKRPWPSDARSTPAQRQAPVELWQERVPHTKHFMDWTANYFIIICVFSQLICPFLFTSLFLIVDSTQHHKDTATPLQTRNGGSQIKCNSAGPKGISVSTDVTTSWPTYLFFSCLLILFTCYLVFPFFLLKNTWHRESPSI